MIFSPYRPFSAVRSAGEYPDDPHDDDRGGLATKAALANLKVWLVLTVVGSNAAFAGILFAALAD